MTAPANSNMFIVKGKTGIKEPIKSDLKQGLSQLKDMKIQKLTGR
jgi:hypothetical protein